MADGSSRTAAMPRIALRLSSEPQRVAGVRRAVESFARQAGGDEREVADIGLCLNEALANVICHAYGGVPGQPIEVAAWRGADGFWMEIRDWGNGVNPEDRARAAEHDPLTPGGLGMICLRRLMDRVVYIPQADGMLLSLNKRLREGREQPAGGGRAEP
jgi:serine/threonine-protein kinase RsbW